MKSMKSMKSFSRDAHAEERAPPLRVRYFYTSPLAIDDPLSAVPPPTTSTSAPLRYAPRPFSKYDNRALTEAWDKLRKQRSLDRAKAEEEKRSDSEEAKRRDSVAETTRAASLGPKSNDVGNGSSIEHRFRSLRIPNGKAQARPSFHAANAGPTSWSSGTGGPSSTSRVRADSIAWRSVHGDANQPESLAGSPENHSYRDDGSILDVEGDTGGITGTPFIRAPSRSKLQTFKRHERSESTSRPSSRGSAGAAEEMVDESRTQVSEASSTVPVGVSRLHQVLLPQLRYETMARR